MLFRFGATLKKISGWLEILSLFWHINNYLRLRLYMVYKAYILKSVKYLSLNSFKKIKFALKIVKPLIASTA